MDRLEAVEVSFTQVYKSTTYFRLEAEYFNSKETKREKLVKGTDIVKKVQYGTSKFLNEDKLGYPVLRLNEFDSMFIKEPAKYCDLLSPNEYKQLQLNKGDVLICRTNGNPNLVGKSAIVTKDFSYAFASYLFRVNPNSKINSETLVVFLNSKYGRIEINKHSIKGNQTNFSPAKFNDISIPLFDDFFQKSIKNIIEKSYLTFDASKIYYEQSENLLLAYLKLSKNTLNTSGITTKSFKSSFGLSGRLDSEYYQSKYEEIETILNCQETVATLCTLYDTNFLPEANTEYQYIELSNIGKSGEIHNVDSYTGSKLPTRARRKVKKGDVIISSIEGSLESCALIDEKYDNALCSTGCYVINSKTINSETLLVLFKSSPIQALMKKRCSGTILTAINKDELLSMPLPYIDTSTQTEIAKKIQKSFALRKQSADLLELAKKAVEVAIEEGEEKAMKMLEGVLDA